MFADVVMGYPIKLHLKDMFDKIKEEKGVKYDTDLTADDLKEVIEI